MHRRLLRSVLPLLALAALLGGCVNYRVVSQQQLDVVGRVLLNIEICQQGDAPGCPIPAGEQSASEIAGPGPVTSDPTSGQALLALLLPTGVTPAATLSTTAGYTTVFRRSTAYEAALQAHAPAPAGTRWWGWISDMVTDYRLDTGARGTTVAVELTLPRAEDGGPFDGPLRYRVGVGFRSANTDRLPTRPLDCTLPIDSDLWLASTDETFCLTQPTVAALASPGTLQTLATRDFGVVGQGGVSTVTAGGATTVAFSVAFDGPAPAPAQTAALTATTTTPGATLQRSRASLPLAADSATPITVTVRVPRTTGPGTYLVRLRAALPGGQSRTGTATLKVEAFPESVRPTARIAKPATPVRRVRGTARDAAPSSGLARVEVAVVRRIGSRCAALEHGAFVKRPCATAATHVTAVRVAASGRWKLALPHLAAARYTVRARAVDHAGNRQQQPATRRFTVS